jgi:hypothetical protein
LLTDIKSKHQKVQIYGASTRGATIWQYLSIDEKLVEYAVERNLDKVGKMTSTGVKIISEEEMRKNPPDYLLVLPWHFKPEIIEREQEMLDKGVGLIFPLPDIEIIKK